jgi:hypothetical protein
VAGTWFLSTLLAILGFSTVQTPVPFKPLASGTQSYIERPRDVVVRTAEAWKAFCAEHDADRPCPPVDFSRSTVVGIFLGTRPTAGVQVEITRIDRDADAMVVTYRERGPAPGEMAAQMITMPFQLVTIERFTGPIRFVRAK